MVDGETRGPGILIEQAMTLLVEPATATNGRLAVVYGTTSPLCSHSALSMHADQEITRLRFGAGLRRGVAVLLAVAALACWWEQPGNGPDVSLADTRSAAVAFGANDSSAPRPAGVERVMGSSGQAYHARAIETIRTGQRVSARNPELAGAELPDAPVDPATWVNIRLRMPKPTGDFLEITLLRPVEWLAEHLAQATALDADYPQALAEAWASGNSLGITEVGSVIPQVDLPEPSPAQIEPVSADQSTSTPWIFLTLPELEAVGPAEIVEVGPCPELEPGEGRLVTGTFSHQSGEVFDITVDGLTEPIGCTGAHPFWSEDRHEFIPARDLRLGETLRTESGTLRQITRITPRRGPPVPVFNLEVDAEHVYYVSVDGVLVHNTYPGNAPSTHGPDVRTLNPVTDPVRPVYKQGHAGQPVVDHIRARAAGGHPTDPSNLHGKPREWNSRKGAYEGQLLKARQEYIRQGLTPEQADTLLAQEWEWLMNDVLARPMDPNVLDNILFPGSH